MSDWLSYYGSWKNARAHMDLKQFAREVLTEENYLRYLESCESTFKVLYIGILAGCLIPVIWLLITRNMDYMILGVGFGLIWMIFWMFLWLIISYFIPQGRIRREFGKWYKNPAATIDELDVIFYKDHDANLTDPKRGKSSVENHELSEKEKRRIRRYGLLLPLGMPFILMGFLNAGVELPLGIIYSLVFHDILFDSGLFLFLGIEVIYMVAFCICSLGPHLGMQGVKWGKIVLKADASVMEKDYSARYSDILGIRAIGSLFGRSDNARMRRAEHVADALAVVGAGVLVAGRINDNLREVKSVADACGVKLPETKKYVRSIVIVPVFLLIAVYVFQFISAKQAMDAQIAVVSESVYALQSALEDECDVWIDDPQEKYGYNGYEVRGYIYHDSYKPADSYIEAGIYVRVDDDGLIFEVEYFADIDIQADKEDNLEMMESDFRELNRMLNDSGVEAVSDDLVDTCELPETFVTRFLEGSYYEEISVKEGENIRVHYVTDTEEDYDKYSYSKVYLQIQSKN